jgi:ribosomal protein L11 methyltransferase
MQAGIIGKSAESSRCGRATCRDVSAARAALRGTLAAFMTTTPEWLELSLETTPELAEAISDALYPLVDGGVSLEQLNRASDSADRWEDEAASGPVIVRAYLTKDERLEERRARVEQALFYLNMVQPVPQPAYRDVAQSDWAESWKAQYRPLRIGRRLVIRPSWFEVDTVETGPEDIVLALDPGMAFGTGLHPTTQLCAMALEERVSPGMRIFDVGTGSGILAIYAIKLGATSALAVDTDPESVRVTNENIGLNGVVDSIAVAQGSFDAVGEEFDLVAANILAGVIIMMLKNGLAARGRRFVFSGILETQADDVKAAAAAAGLRLIEHKQMLDWVGLIFER